MEYMPTEKLVIKAMKESSSLAVKMRLEQLNQAIEDDDEGLIIAIIIQHEHLLTREQRYDYREF